MIDLGNSATVAAWVGALGQTSTAVLAAYIAYNTHRQAKRNAQATAVSLTHEMVNEFNKIALQSPQLAKAVSELRAPVQNTATDALVFIYINFLRTTVAMAQSGLISRDERHTTLANGAMWLARMDRDILKAYLDHGYTASFSKLVLREYDRARKVRPEIGIKATSPQR